MFHRVACITRHLMDALMLHRWSTQGRCIMGPIHLAGVARTLALTLRARADEHARPDALFRDPLAVTWFAQLPRYADQDAWFNPAVQTSAAIRAHMYDELTERFFAAHPHPVVVELGAGLSTRYFRVGQGRACWIELDLPQAIAVRRQFDGETAEHTFLATSIDDPG